MADADAIAEMASGNLIQNLHLDDDNLSSVNIYMYQFDNINVPVSFFDWNQSPNIDMCQFNNIYVPVLVFVWNQGPIGIFIQAQLCEII
jgi:hypothetical protein